MTGSTQFCKEHKFNQSPEELQYKVSALTARRQQRQDCLPPFLHKSDLSLFFAHTRPRWIVVYTQKLITRKLIQSHDVIHVMCRMMENRNAIDVLSSMTFQIYPYYMRYVQFVCKHRSFSSLNQFQHQYLRPGKFCHSIHLGDLTKNPEIMFIYILIFSLQL